MVAETQTLTRDEVCKRGRFARAPKAIMARRDLSANAKLAYFAILDKAGDKRRTPIRDQEIADAAGISYRGAQLARKELAAAGLLTFDTKPGLRGGVTYAFRTPAVPTEGASVAPLPGKPEGAQPAPIGGHNGASVAQPLEDGLDLEQRLDIPEGGEPHGEPAKVSDGRGEKQPKQNTGQLVTAWHKGHKAQTGAAFARSATGKLGGMLKRATGDHGHELVYAAIGRWFGQGRTDYGPGLFLARLNGGNAELHGRGAGTPRTQGQFNAAPAPAETYAGAVTTYDCDTPGEEAAA